MATTVVSFRIKPEEIAKAYEGLLDIGTDANTLNTISSIVRTTFYYGIIQICKDPQAQPSTEVVEKINQILNQSKSKNVGIEDLMKGE